MKVVFSALASIGIEEIGDYIAQDNPLRAYSFVRELRAKATDIGRLPYAFPVVAGLERKRIRRRPHGDYVILYRIEDDRIVIVLVTHAARDWQGLLR